MTEKSGNILHRLRQLVDEENAMEQWRARWAKRLGLLFAIPILLLLIWLISHA
ncbi:MAG: hypothetical protein Q8S26_05830 [Azonexus sp.]|nr:hypothetical protein [Azonexus sp.]